MRKSIEELIKEKQDSVVRKILKNHQKEKASCPECKKSSGNTVCHIQEVGELITEVYFASETSQEEKDFLFWLVLQLKQGYALVKEIEAGVSLVEGLGLGKNIIKVGEVSVKIPRPEFIALTLAQKNDWPKLWGESTEIAELVEVILAKESRENFICLVGCLLRLDEIIESVHKQAVNIEEAQIRKDEVAKRQKSAVWN